MVLFHLCMHSVFTLQSIKSRIETQIIRKIRSYLIRFLLYSPLNQGLKLLCGYIEGPGCILFLLYSPLNQGLKRTAQFSHHQFSSGFLLYSPLNQGLKLANTIAVNAMKRVFTLQSIKSRIETKFQMKTQEGKMSFYSTVH